MNLFLRKSSSLVGLMLLVLLVGGCSDFVDAAQPSNSFGLGSPVTAIQNVGQTFVARHGGLNSISVFAAVDGPPGDGVAVLHLRDDPMSSQGITQATCFSLRFQAPVLTRSPSPLFGSREGGTQTRVSLKNRPAEIRDMAGQAGLSWEWDEGWLILHHTAPDTSTCQNVVE